MQNPQIQQMNNIIKEWKTHCVYDLHDVFLDDHINKSELASKSWADIIRTAYKLVNEHDVNKAEKVSGSNAMIANLLIISATSGLRGFDYDPAVFRFYGEALGPARDVALSLMRDRVIIGKEEKYAILPAGTPWNNGNPVGIQNITPRAVEIVAVSDNPDAHQVNDILICQLTYAAVIRAVPELPKPMQDWAIKNNVKLH